MRLIIILLVLFGTINESQAQYFNHGKGAQFVELSYANIDLLDHQLSAGYGRFLNNSCALRFSGAYSFSNYNEIKNQGFHLGSRFTYYPVNTHPFYIGVYAGLQGTLNQLDLRNNLDTTDYKRQLTAYSVAGTEVEVFILKDKISIPFFTEVQYSPIASFAKLRWSIGTGIRFNFINH